MNALKEKKTLLLRFPSSVLRRIRHPCHYYPELTLKYIQSGLRQKNIDTKLVDGWVDFSQEHRLIKSICDYAPRLILVYLNFVDTDYVVKFLARIRELLPGLIIGASGTDATWKTDCFSIPDSLVDFIFKGEPEKDGPELISRLLSDRDKPTETIHNCYLEDPDQLPFPEFSREELMRYSFIYPVRLNKKVYCGYLKSSWGCPHHCIFCSQTIRKSYTNIVRFRRAENVVDEIEKLMRLGVNFISFEDDNFSSSSDHVISICHQIKKRNLRIKWTAQCRVDEVDKELLTEMKSAGCDFIQFGVESGSERIIKLLSKQDDSKEWVHLCLKSFREAREAGIVTLALFIIGSPTETLADVHKSIGLAKKMKCDLLKLHFFCPYPGSSIYEEILKNNPELKKPSLHHHDIPRLNLSQIPQDAMVKLRKKFYIKVMFNPTCIIRHIYRYFTYYVHNIRILRYMMMKTIGLLIERAYKGST